MSYYQYLTQNSFLKLLAGVFFAAFILTACGGGGGGAAAPAAAAAADDGSSGGDGGNTDGGGDNSGDGGNTDGGGDNSGDGGNTDGGGDNSGDGGNNSGDGGNTDACAGKYVETDGTCPNDIVASCTDANQLVKGNLCLPIVQADCDASGEYFNGSNCETIITSCDSNQVVANNVCVAVADPCPIASQYYNDASFACAETKPFAHVYFTDAVANTNPLLDATTYTNTAVKCGEQAIGTNADQFGSSGIETDEYYRSGAKDIPNDDAKKAKTAQALICLSTAYARIDNLINHEESNGVKLNKYQSQQAGGGQTVAVLATGFNTAHDEFDYGTSTQFSSVYDASSDTTYSTYSDITGAGNCNGCIKGTQDASIIAARIGGGTYGTHDMQGIAYNAELKGIAVDMTVEAQRLRAIPQGVGADIAVMHNNWAHNDVSCNFVIPKKPDGTNVGSGDASYYFNRPVGQDFVATSSCTAAGVASAKLASTELTAWRNATDITSSNQTIMVFSTGRDGFNSINGEVDIYTDAALSAGKQTVKADSLIADAGVAVNIPNFYAAYPELYDETDASSDTTDFTSGRWLAVTSVDENLLIHKKANGCGVAMTHCLAAPAEAHAAAHGGDGYLSFNSGSNHSGSAFVSGGLAVLKAAFPTMTPEQLTKLVLETASYIDINSAGDVEADDLVHEVTLADGTTKRLINEVYGYGMLNLNKATTPDATAAISMNSVGGESVHLLWSDASLTPSNHFGGGLDDVTFGIGDNYGRHFIASPMYNNYTPVTHNIDDYMAGFFGENVQSETLGVQAKSNYANNGNQSWMDLEYKAGNITSKIAFQDSYKSNPLTDMGATFELRANNIRPASNNIGMMDVDYQFGRNVSLSSYAARGEYDTGYKFDELGTDIDLRHKKSTLSLGIGHLREHDQFLGTNTTGAYELGEPSISQFTDVTYGRDLGNRFNIYANYINYKTDVDMGYQDFADIEGLQADQYQIGFKGKNILTENDGLDVALITKLGVTDGALTQNTALGYTQAGELNNVTQSYDLAVSERHQQLEITYQGKLYQKSQGSVSLLKENRFFSTVIVDRNLNNQQGVSQTEIIGGVRARF